MLTYTGEWRKNRGRERVIQRHSLPIRDTQATWVTFFYPEAFGKGQVQSNTNIFSVVSEEEFRFEKQQSQCLQRSSSGDREQQGMRVRTTNMSSRCSPLLAIHFL